MRQDTRKHTRHILRPEANAVARYLRDPTASSWRSFAQDYRKLLGERYAGSPEAFEALRDLATEGDLWLGCNCPTAKNPDVRHCHTFLALQYLAERFPELEIQWPSTQ